MMGFVVLGERNGNSNSKGKGVLGWLIVCDPTHRKGAMDGAPGRRFIGMIKATATADFSATAEECAAFGRNDGVCGVGGEERKQQQQRQGRFRLVDCLRSHPSQRRDGWGTRAALHRDDKSNGNSRFLRYGGRMRRLRSK